MSSKRQRLIVGISIFLLISAAILTWWVTHIKTATVVEGFVPFSSFRDSDPPGTVYRQSANGDIRKVIELQAPIHTAQEVTYELKANREFTAEQFVNAGLSARNCNTSKGNFKPGAKGSVFVSSLNGEREYTFDADLDASLANLKKMFANKSIMYRPDETYWIIRETIRTKNVSYESSTSWLMDAGADIVLKSCADQIEGNSKLKLSWGQSNKVALVREFDKPLRGWYIADELQLRVPFGAAPTADSTPSIKIIKSGIRSSIPVF